MAMMLKMWQLRCKWKSRWNCNEDENVEGNFKFVMNRMIFFAENVNECPVRVEGPGGGQGPGWRASEMGSVDINEKVNECIFLLYKGGGSGGGSEPRLTLHEV